MHFFSPAHIMKLVEVVAGAQTSAATLKTVVQVGKRIGKVCVVVRNLPGFVGNRMIFNYALEAMLLLEEGVSVSHIDELLVDFGFPMGVFAMQDMAGLDIGYRVRAEHGLLIQDHASSRYSRIGDDLYSLGRYGCKTGRGFYKYEEGSRRPIPDNHVAEIIAKRRREEPVPSDTEVLQRLLFPLINEGFKVLEERGVLSGRPGDVDIILVLGYGWPAYKGGALFYAEVIEGLDRVLQGLRTYSARWPECSYFTPSTLLEMMVARKVSVFDIQQDPSKLDGLLAPKPRL
jgi:3-hydroxyacyl-CoA dehydrogenase